MEGRVPMSSDIQTEGIFYQHYFQCVPETERYFRARFHACALENPLLAQQMEYFIGMDLCSKLDGDGLQGWGGRSNLDIVVVLDISGSMDGTFEILEVEQGEEEQLVSKMDAAKESLTKMLSVLTDRDRLALVTFNTQAEQLTNLTPMNEEGREVAMEAIRGLRADGGTDMLKGMTMAAEILQSVLNENENTKRIFFFTDALISLPQVGNDPLLEFSKEVASQGISTTYFGVGCDFDSAVVATISACDGCNYHSILSSAEFSRLLSEDFPYLVTIVAREVMVALDQERSRGVRLTQAFSAGTNSGAEMVKVTQQVNIGHIFPTHALKSSEGLLDIKGGMVVFGLEVDPDEEDPCAVFRVNHLSMAGERFDETVEVPIRAAEECPKALRVGVALARFCMVMRNIAVGVRKPADRATVLEPGYLCSVMSPPLDPSLDASSIALNTAESQEALRFSGAMDHLTAFLAYLRREMADTGDESLDMEASLLSHLISVVP